MGRQALLLVAAFAIFFGLMRMGLNRNAKRVTRANAEQYQSAAARNAANSAVQLALNDLQTDRNWRTGYSNLNLSVAVANLDVVDSSEDPSLGPDTIRLQSTAIAGDQTASVSVKVAVDQPELPDEIKGGITSRASIGTLGNMMVDGRDHDLNGNLIADSGTKAITTLGTYTAGGSSDLAGTTAAGADYGPVHSGYGSIVDEHYTWPSGSYPTTPEDVLGGASAGLGANALKTAAQSGANGSQYATNPASLHFPLQGITYVELPNGGTWSSMDFGNSSGLLIVHNTSSNALIQNLNTGTFRGLIIADDMMHIHCQIIGAVFLLTASPRYGSCIGNGNGELLFSREAILDALDDAQLSLASLNVLEYWE